MQLGYRYGLHVVFSICFHFLTTAAAYVWGVTAAAPAAFSGFYPPARRYASAGYRDRNVSVRLSVCLSVRHAPVLCQNEES